jgi:NAD(P)-dependent dehydrogenase (short-subunit alcohol dehydrogenase family)
MTKTLDGKVALITGTGGGQGRVAALRFTAEGATVVGCDVNASAAKETLDAVTTAGGTMISSAPVDLSDPAQAQGWVEQAARDCGRIDVVYNNASATRFGPVPDLPVEDWYFTLRNELDLVFLVTKYAWPHLAVNGGVIINVGSVAGLRGNRNAPMVAHAASKGGVIAMTRQLAVEGAAHGIRAVSISPGTIQTPGTAEILSQPAVRDALLAQSLVPRLGQPGDVVEVAVFLASSGAEYLTGIDIAVDGGMTAL